MRNPLRASLCSILHCRLWPAYLLAIVLVPALSAQNEPVRVIAFGAHPDDCDLGAGGLAAGGAVLAAAPGIFDELFRLSRYPAF